MADRTALSMAESRCQDLLRSTARASGMSDWVTMMLREANDGMPTLAELAHLVNLSPRSLERHLAREGRGFLDLSKRIRHDNPCVLLAAGNLPVTQVAYQLGYRDVANFTRAFRRECGTTPSEYRHRKRAAG